MSRLKSLLVIAVVGLACQGGVEPVPPPPPPVPPPPPPPPVNQPPVAVPGGPYTSSTGTVVFNGSGSSDPDGDPLTYAWTFGDGATSTAVNPTHTYGADGTFQVSLKVTDNRGAASPAATTSAVVARPAPAVTFTGAGNIASCGGNGDEATAAILDRFQGAVFTLGDNAFQNGSNEDYNNCYDPSWGRHKTRTRPTLGNHDYQLGNADGAFDYFGEAAGPRGLGYYSYDVGTWHVIVLNDNIAFNGGSDQAQWLANDLAQNQQKRCTIAMWHVPLFISTNQAGYNENSTRRTLWERLHNAGVDIVLNGHPHHYERFRAMRPNGTADDNGIRQFTVGTGGSGGLLLPTDAVHPNSEVQGAVVGVLKLSLKDGGYDWEFVGAAGSSFSDAGSGTCH